MDAAPQDRPAAPPRAITFRRFNIVYAITGLVAAAVLLIPEATEDPTHYRIIYSMWATTALLIPVVALFIFRSCAVAARGYWQLFWTAAFILYVIHFYYAVFVHFGGIAGTFRGQEWLIAGGNFVLTAIWTWDIIVTWVIRQKDYRTWNRHLLALAIIVLAFLFFAVVRNDGVIRWIGVGLAVTALACIVLRIRYADRCRERGEEARPEGAPWREVYLGGSKEAEAEMVFEFARQINGVQERQKKQSGSAVVQRGFHAKPHLGVIDATFRVVADVPNDFQHGLFAEPGEYRAAIRFSNASGVVQPDSTRDLRGLAVRVWLDDDRRNGQDFLATNAPSSHARDAHQFMVSAVVGSRRFRILAPLRLIFRLGIVEAVRMIIKVLRTSRRVPSLVSESFWSRAAIAVGREAVRYTFVPAGQPVTAADFRRDNFLRENLLDHLRQGDLKYDLVFQRFVNEKQTPIEDNAVEWTEAASPPFKVAELVISQRSMDSPAAAAMEAEVERMAFDVWHTTRELRPLGSQNRARQLVYKSSADFRGRRKKAVHEGLIAWLFNVLLVPVFRFINRWWPWHRVPGARLQVVNIDALRYDLRQENLYEPRPQVLPVPSTEIDEFDSNKTYHRQPDGTYNDLTDVDMGAAETVFGRNTPLDQLQVPSNDSVVSNPTPRAVSRQLLTRETFQPATTLNMLAAAWIQFQIHGWFNHTRLATVFDGSRWQIPLEEDDPWREYGDAMEVPKTKVLEPPTAGLPATFANTETHWWDASQLYGSHAAITERLRANEKGYLKVGENRLLPPAEKRGRTDDDVRVIDDTGFNDNYWLGLSLMHTLFVHEHNAICDYLAVHFPRWNDEELFQKARLINAALIAKIHTVEWTPGILGREALRLSMRANWWGVLGEEYKKAFGRRGESEEKSGIMGSPTDHHTAPYALTEEFVAVYRMHPLVPDDYTFRRYDTHEGYLDRTFSEIDGANGRKVMEKAAKDKRLADLYYSFGTSHPGAITLRNYPRSLQNFETFRGHRLDLGTVDILRDRERAVPRYNDFRRNLRLPPIRRWEDITRDPALGEEIRRLYGSDLEKVDTMVGLHAETPPTGFGFSDTAFRIFILMASRRLKSDRFFTNDYSIDMYTVPGMEWIQNSEMTDVLLRHYPELQPSLNGLGNAFAPWQVASHPRAERGEQA